ncbi:hypothetical protein AB5I41_04260 [Sphingomonas sp. MMS24-JH45]
MKKIAFTLLLAGAFPMSACSTLRGGAIGVAGVVLGVAAATGGSVEKGGVGGVGGAVVGHRSWTTHPATGAGQSRRPPSSARPARIVELAVLRRIARCRSDADDPFHLIACRYRHRALGKRRDGEQDGEDGPAAPQTVPLVANFARSPRSYANFVSVRASDAAILASTVSIGGTCRRRRLSSSGVPRFRASRFARAALDHGQLVAGRIGQ